MKQVRDKTGRFKLRPHYEPIELDRACEKVLTEFFRPTHGAIPIPIPTDDLTRLIERDTSDFDPGADLSAYGPDVEGVTLFRPGHKPQVKISAELAYEERRENRYRTTLTHEYGHVHFHAYLFDLEVSTGDLSARNLRPNTQVCKRDNMLAAPISDWMEWQAGYACGAFLMPISRLLETAQAFTEDRGPTGPIVLGSQLASELIDLTRVTFSVSADAARVRLLQQRLIVREASVTLAG